MIFLTDWSNRNGSFLFVYRYNELHSIIVTYCMDVRPSVRTYICQKMYHEQTAEPRSASFFENINVDSVNSPANFHPNRQWPWPSFSMSKIRIDYIGKFVREYIVNDDRSGKHC